MKFLSNHERERSFVNYEKAHSILLLFESDLSEKNTEIKNIISELSDSGKKVTAYGFVNKRNTITPIYSGFRILHSKDCNLVRIPSVGILKEIQESHYDLLIDLSTRKVLPLSYIALYSNAKCKAGMQKEGPEFFDFMLDLSHADMEHQTNSDGMGSGFLYNQIIFYLKSIQTND